jgi:hypothetical protein
MNHSRSIDPSNITEADQGKRTSPDVKAKRKTIVSARVDAALKAHLQDIARVEQADLTDVIRQALVVRCGGSPQSVRRPPTLRENKVRIIRSPAATDVALLVALQTVEQSLRAILLNSCLGRSGSYRQDAIMMMNDIRSLIRNCESTLELPHVIA